MDSKETLASKPAIIKSISSFSTFPVLGMIFVLIASTAFYFSRTHDEQVWLNLYDLHSPYLLKKEKSLYLDFYNKRLSIEKLGSQKQLSLISDAIKSKDNQLITRLILSDRGFRTYLIQKAPIYFSPTEKERWFAHNKELTNQLVRLTSYQFAIIPEAFASSPSIAKLFTYIFVDDQLENFISNALILLLLSSILERFIKRKIYAAAIISSSLGLSCLYIFIMNSFSSPLQGLNGLIYFLAIALFSTFIKVQYSTKFTRSWPFLLIGLALISFKVLFDFYYHFFNKDLLFCFIPLGVCAVLLACFHQRLFFKEIPSKNQTNASMKHDIEHLTNISRHHYAEALSGLSRFNFYYARQALRSLRKEHPNSLKILDSSYHLEKLCAEEADFWALAENRIEHCLISQNYPEMLSIFHDIQIAAPSRKLAGKNISPNCYLKMLIVFLNHNDIEKAEHAFMFLELTGEPNLVKEACKLLIETFSKKQNSKKTNHYQALFESYLEAN